MISSTGRAVPGGAWTLAQVVQRNHADKPPVLLDRKGTLAARHQVLVDERAHAHLRLDTGELRLHQSRHRDLCERLADQELAVTLDG
jgi:hypothetical protein